MPTPIDELHAHVRDGWRVTATRRQAFGSSDCISFETRLSEGPEISAGVAQQFHTMSQPNIDLSTMRKALAMLIEVLTFWAAQPDGAPLKPHLRSAVIQSFEFSYELSVRLLRRVLIERSESADRVADLSFNDLLRAGADAGLLTDATQWREWREMRNATGHAYDEARAQAVAQRAAAFAEDATALLAATKGSLEH